MASSRAEPRRAGAVLADLLELTKPRIVVMVLVTAGVAALVAGGRSADPVLVLNMLIGTALVAGSAGVWNQLLERVVDGRMARTRFRPLPDGRLAAAPVAAFGSIMGVLGVAYLAMLVGSLPALVGVATWVAYVIVYTPLKTRTAWNTTVGAVSGALPMLIGYTATGGQLSAAEGWLLVAVLGLWQYPHFMAIAWIYRYQYGLAGMRMTPVVEPSGRSAGWQAVVGAAALPIVLVTLVAFRPWGPLLALAAVLVSLGMLRAAIRFARSPDDLTARQLLRSSLLQLPSAMAVLLVSALL